MDFLDLVDFDTLKGAMAGGTGSTLGSGSLGGFDWKNF